MRCVSKEIGSKTYTGARNLGEKKIRVRGNAQGNTRHTIYRRLNVGFQNQAVQSQKGRAGVREMAIAATLLIPTLNEAVAANHVEPKCAIRNKLELALRPSQLRLQPFCGYPEHAA